MSRDFVFVYGQAVKVKKRTPRRIVLQNGKRIHPSDIFLDKLTENEAMKAQKELDHIRDHYDQATDDWRSRWLKRTHENT